MTLTPELRERLKGLNDLIRAVYEKPLTVSSILMAAGFSEEQIAALRDQHLERFLDLSTLGVRCGTSRIQRSRLLSDIRELSFGFGAAPKATLEELGQQMGVSRQRIFQLKGKSLRPLRPRKDEDPLLEIFRAAANEILGIQLTDLTAHVGTLPDDDPAEDQVDF